MRDEEFWKLISLIDMDLVNQEDDFTGVQPLTEALAKKPAEDITHFHELLAMRLFALDSQDRFDVSCGSDDGFLYQRCYMIASGKAVYEKAVQDPKDICDEMEWCEALLYVAGEAWEVNQIAEWDFDPSVSYETGSNKALYS